MHLCVLILIASLLLAAEGVGGFLAGEGPWFAGLPLLAFVLPACAVVVEMVVVRRTVAEASAGFISSVRRASSRLMVLQ